MDDPRQANEKANAAQLFASAKMCDLFYLVFVLDASLFFLLLSSLPLVRMNNKQLLISKGKYS